jgi:hypothetical protein
MEAGEDQFFREKPQLVFDPLQSPNTFAPFTDEDGAEKHCLAGALAYKDEVVFNWLDDTLRRNR